MLKAVLGSHLVFSIGFSMLYVLILVEKNKVWCINASHFSKIKQQYFLQSPRPTFCSSREESKTHFMQPGGRFFIKLTWKLRFDVYKWTWKVSSVGAEKKLGWRNVTAVNKHWGSRRGGPMEDYLPVNQTHRHDDLMTAEIKVNKSWNNENISGFIMFG